VSRRLVECGMARKAIDGCWHAAFGDWVLSLVGGYQCEGTSVGETVCAIAHTS
jgi:hypothetical protein